MTRIPGALILSLLLLASCHPATTRPTFLPLPESARKEVKLLVPEATQQVAIALDADSIPVHRTEASDGWLESDWFDARSYRPTKARRLGEGVVKVRAWIEPEVPGISSMVTIETVFRPYADPSREDRALEQVVPSAHPVAMKVFRILDSLARKYGS